MDRMWIEAKHPADPQARQVARLRAMINPRTTDLQKASDVLSVPQCYRGRAVFTRSGHGIHDSSRNGFRRLIRTWTVIRVTCVSPKAEKCSRHAAVTFDATLRAREAVPQETAPYIVSRSRECAANRPQNFDEPNEYFCASASCYPVCVERRVAAIAGSSIVQLSPGPSSPCHAQVSSSGLRSTNTRNDGGRGERRHWPPPAQLTRSRAGPALAEWHSIGLTALGTRLS